MPQAGPQTEAIRKHWVDELFFGGAVGGGKSDFLLGDFGQDVPNYGSAWRGILFRRTYGELEELISRSQEIYPGWFPGVEWKASANTWLWPNGAHLKMRYLESTTDWMRYWGHQYTWIGWDELPSWPDMVAYNKMKARLRSAHAIPNKRIRATGNPGGPGHQAVKAYFGIDKHPNGGVIFTDEATGTTRLFVKSMLTDNALLLANDPAYAQRLRGLGSEALVKAWMDGDWSVIAGAYFDGWSSKRHVIKPFTVPAHWLRFGSFDWGSAKPFSYQEWAISDGSLLPVGLHLPTGAMVCIREWYGASEPNVGLKMTAEEIADGIKAREEGNISYRVADPALFKVDGGPSQAERMAKRGVLFRHADNSRISGWDQLRQRLAGDDAPMIYWFDTCVDSIRTIPALQHDEDKPEDVDSDGEDHAGDSARYACMSRPYTRKAPVTYPFRGAQDMTMNEAWKLLQTRPKDHNARI